MTNRWRVSKVLMVGSLISVAVARLTSTVDAIQCFGMPVDAAIWFQMTSTSA
jgi:uncharacterized membrane protein